VEKIRRFRNVSFDSKTFLKAHEVVNSLASSKINYGALSVQTAKDEEWRYNSFEEFLAAADQGVATFELRADKDLRLYFNSLGPFSMLSVSAPSREQIERITSVFEADAERCRVPEYEEQTEPKVFIGHGGSPQWKELKDHLHEKHGYAVEAYEIGSRAGHTIRDILEKMLKESSFALLVMTGEDETKDGRLLPRLNVVHEAGLFQGKLGFTRAIVILEKGTEEFSNIAGIQQIRFSKGKIRESFGDVLAVLDRELK